MSTRRHRTLLELATDVVDRITPTVDPVVPRALAATNFRQIIDEITNSSTFPLVLVVATGAQYGKQPGAFRSRDDRVNVVIAGAWSSDVAGSDTEIWTLADACANRFLPGNDDGDAVGADPTPSPAVEINGVTYHPLTLRPVAVGAERTCMNLLLQAINDMRIQS